MIRIDKYKAFPGDLKLELVERKGLGHPDTIADNIAENFSKELCRAYINDYGSLMHHNVDKLDLVGGSSKPSFGGGSIIEPVTIFFSGRATMPKSFPLQELADKAVRNVFNETVPRLLDHYELIVKTRKGSVDLVKNFRASGKIPRANDTSFGAGFYPLTIVEEMVLRIEKYLQSLRSSMKFIGSDIKVMGVRQGKKIVITIALAMIDSFINSPDEYFSFKQEVLDKVIDFVNSSFPNQEVEIAINLADSRSKKIYYLTVSGSSIESGDDGAVGRGNRLNGLITPYRHMSLEAYHGKNPFNHTGKIYNFAAMELSKLIYEELNTPNEVILLSRIGKPINKPFINILLKDRSLSMKAKSIVKNYFENDFLSITDRILRF